MVRRMNEQTLVEILESLNCEILEFEGRSCHFIDNETKSTLALDAHATKGQIISLILENRDQYEILSRIGVTE